MAVIRYSDQKQHTGEESLFHSQFQVTAITEGKSRQELNQASNLITSTVESTEKPMHPPCLPAAAYAQLAFSTLMQFRIFCLGDGAAHIRGGSFHPN